MDESINALDWTGGTEPTRDDIAHAAEALLFVTDEPVSVVTLADMLGVDVVSVQAALECLSETLLHTIAAYNCVKLRWMAFDYPPPIP